MTRWRAASLIGVHLLFGLHFAHWKIAGRTLAPIEPSEMFDTLHLGIITVGFLFMAGLVLATSVAGRFFCSWGCHILALQDLCAWMLKKLGIRTRPIRSRALLWVPPLAVVYLFVWPQLRRMLHGQALPSLHVVSDPDGWTSFTTTDLLRSFPGLGMTLFTFAICGFAIVYFLGSRSFCSYACPYGAIFAAAERLAPLRIIAGPGECSQCGLCVASCPSSVRVIEEVRQFGTVMNSSCMKDLDCISVCPTDALKYGLTKPPLLRSWRSPRSLKKQYDFSLPEDLLMATLFVAILPVIRGLYDAISLLLALAITALLAYFAILSVRLGRQPRVQLSNFQLKTAGRLTAGGWTFATLAGALGLFVIHSAFIRYHTYVGEWALAEIQSSGDTSGLRGGATEDPISAADFTTATSQSRSTALAHLEQAYRWGLIRPPGLRRQLAFLYQQAGKPTQARIQLHALLRQDPGDQESRLRLGRLWLQDGHLNLAKQQFQQVLASVDASYGPLSKSQRDRSLQGSAHFFLGDVEARSGKHGAAMRQFELAVRANPRDVEAHLALGAMQAAAGRLQAAEASFRTSVQLRPDSAAAHNNLAAILVRLNREEEALDHYRQSLASMPDNPLAYYNVGLLLVNLGELDEAEETFQQVLDLHPGDASAHAGLALVWQRRGQPEKAAWHRERAAQLTPIFHKPSVTRRPSP
jgi:tetratricopeptide (TPR) repeat protein/polyferredoxin